MDENEIYIKVTKRGPYLVYGKPEIFDLEILTNDNEECTDYGNKKIVEYKANPIALCRCGNSKNAPFCDGSHLSFAFQGDECASFEPILKNANKYEGVNLILMDNEKYCAFARFCDAKGSVWNLINDGTKESDDLAVKETSLCPSGRLWIFDKNGNLLEDEIPKAVAILEDTGLKISGPIWVSGGIRVESADGESYEIRNRQTLCRCGRSDNKPFCDCTHKHINFQAKQ